MYALDAPLMTLRDKARLVETVDRLRGSGRECDRLLDSLQTHLRRAYVVRTAEAPPDLVTMNSTVETSDPTGRLVERVTLAYPGDGDRCPGAVSVVSAQGLALLGARVGEVVRWPEPPGSRRVRIERLIYQPEAAGDLRL